MTSSPDSNASALQAGSIQHLGSGPTGAESVETFDLARELIARLQRGGDRQLPGREVRLLGILQSEIEGRVDLPDNRYSATKSTSSLRTLMMHPDVDSAFARLRDTVCVDLGCGGLNPLGPSFGLILAGARRAVGIDLEPVIFERHAVRALHRCFAAVVAGATKPRFPITGADAIARVADFDLARIAAGDASGIPSDRLAFIRAPIEESGLQDGSVDLVTSTSFFEHVPDPDAIIGTLAQLSKVGALGVHTIDGVDHRSYGPGGVHELEFLRDRGTERLIHGCNRIRPLQFRELFERRGFEVRDVQVLHRLSLSEAEIASFVAPYRSMSRDELECVGVRYFVRRR